jgi:O-antigen/teichoic acid export membrane protein
LWGNGRRAGPWAYLKGALCGKNSLAILDQSVVSSTRFLTSIIVGRSCGPHELGDYTLGFTLYCLGASVLAGLISLPFTVYGNYLHGEERRAYSGSVLVLFATFEVSVMVILGLATSVLALGYGWPELVPLVRVLAITFPLALVVEFARRFALARLELTAALATDVTMSAIQVGSLLVLTARGQLSAEAAFVAMGLGGAIAGLTWLALARRRFVIDRSRLLADALRNWRFGWRLLASQQVLVARNMAVLWLVALVLDPASTGLFAACDSLVRLSAPLQMAVASVFFAKAAGASARGDMFAVRRLARQAAGRLGTATGLLFVLFVWFGGPVLAKLYGAAYGPQGGVLSLLALAMVADALEIVATNGLMALDRSHILLVANLVSTLLTLTIAALLIPGWGIVGAAWGSLLGRAGTSALLWAMFLKGTRASNTAEVEP